LSALPPLPREGRKDLFEALFSFFKKMTRSDASFFSPGSRFDGGHRPPLPLFAAGTDGFNPWCEAVFSFSGKLTWGFLVFPPPSPNPQVLLDGGSHLFFLFSSSRSGE